MSIIAGSRRNQSDCMCSTMRSRIDELKERKLIKQNIYSSITAKYGKNANVQKILLKVFQTNTLKECNIEEIDKIIQKGIEKSSINPIHKTSSSVNINSPTPEFSSGKQIVTKIPLNEEQQWATIVENDVAKFYKEDMERLAREKENKRRLKKELDKQVQYKQNKLIEEESLNRHYDDQQMKFIRTLKAKDLKYENDLKYKTYQENKVFDMQCKDIKKRQIKDFLQNQEYEKNLVRKIKEDIRFESAFNITKRNQEKQAFLNLIHEHEEKKRKAYKENEKEKQRDLAYIKEYISGQ